MTKPVIMKKEAFKVAGYGIQTGVASGFTKDIAAYWETYTGENLESKLYAQLNPPKHGEIGICVSTENGENGVYLLGVFVEDYSKITPYIGFKRNNLFLKNEGFNFIILHFYEILSWYELFL